MAKIGIGITTFNRPEMLAECKANIAKHTSFDNILIYIADDSGERKGIAFRKNECLRALQDCDHILLFDDDCHPIKEGWIDFFINSGWNHLLYMNEKFHRKNYEKAGLINFFDCGGVFIYIDKETLQRVGAFNEKFTMYGFEHAEWSNRIEGRKDSYFMLKGTSDYLFAHDYENPHHHSSLRDEDKEKFVKLNSSKYHNEPIKSIYIPL